MFIGFLCFLQNFVSTLFAACCAEVKIRTKSTGSEGRGLRLSGESEFKSQARSKRRLVQREGQRPYQEEVQCVAWGWYQLWSPEKK